MHRLKLDLLHGWGSNCSQGFIDSLTLLFDENDEEVLFYLCGHYMCLTNIVNNTSEYT